MQTLANIPSEFYQLLPQFEAKFYGRQKRFDEQRFLKPSPKHPNGKFYYHEMKRPLLQSDWVSHFYTSPRDIGNRYTVGSLSLHGICDDGLVRWVSIDIDNYDQMNAWKSKLKPKLDSLDIEYFIEWGGDEDHNGEFNRCHVIIFYDNVELAAATDHINQIFYEIGEPLTADVLKHFPNKKEVLFDEVFPINKPKNKIRPIFGFNLKPGRNRRYPCEYNGRLIEDPIEAIKTVIDIKTLTLFDLECYKNNDIIAKLNDKVKVFKPIHSSHKRTYYTKLINLGLPFEEVPDKLRPVVRNCQAINTLLERVKDGLINKAGSTYHDAQLMLRGMTKYIDAQYKIDKGEEFYNFLRDNYRFRPDTEHNLETNDHDDEPIRYFSSCAKWNEYFGLCEGCPFLNKVGNPVRFIKAESIKSQKIKRLSFSTIDQIRKEEFPRLRKKLLEDIERGFEKFIVYGHPTGAGKSSSLVRQAIVDILGTGRKVLIAVNSIELAKEYKAGLKANDIDSFILASHQSTFNPSKPKSRITDLVCPFYDEIQNLNSLGVSSSTYKDTYCKNCPLYDQCPYPRQYTEVQDESHNVVIIQHAHFSCEEVLYDLLGKGFDVLFIDETFIDSLYNFVPVSDQELELLTKQPFSWCQDIVRWLTSVEDANGIIDANELELEIVRSTFTTNNVKWIVPELIRFYNQGRQVVNQGVEVIYTLPRTPITVTTDATCPTTLMQMLTGVDSVEVHGLDTIIDYKSIHPDNEVIQVLDFTASVTWLKEEDTFDAIMRKISIDIDDEKKSFITTYLKSNRRIIEWFERESPHLLPKVVLGALQRGVNTYADFDRQIILANVLFMPENYYEKAYRYIKVANYHRERKGLPLIPIPTTKEVHTVLESIQRAESSGFLVEYPQFQVRKPYPSKNIMAPSYMHRLIYEMIIGTIKQSIRVRFTPDKPRQVIIINNVPLPGVKIDKSITLSQYLAGDY